MPGAREMRFAGVGPEPERSIDRGLGQGTALRSMIETTQGIKGVVGGSELALRGEEGRIACQRLIQQIDS